MLRREFLSRLCRLFLGGLAAAFGLRARAGDRTTFTLGFPSEYPPGTVRHLLFYDAFLISDEEGIYAVSSVCTHRGGPLFKTDADDAFVCRRHHSRFDLRGDVTRGPAYESLPWLKLELDRDGRIVLRRRYRGERGVKIPHT